MAYILLVGGDLNGPVIGAIFTIVGFAAFGKHPRNIVPIMVGVFLGTLAKPWERARSVAPARRAVRHHARADRRALRLALGDRRPASCMRRRRKPSALHAGLNLYNNGFAAGIVAPMLVPVIIAIRARSEKSA